ncbi:MAG: ATP-binding protein [Acidobacteriota bacterium]
MITEEHDILEELVTECRAHLSVIEPDLRALEAAHRNATSERINRVFRAVHGIKGGCGLLGLSGPRTLAHAIESVLMKVRDGDMAATQDVVSVVLSGLGRLGSLLDAPTSSGQPELGELLERLGVFLDEDERSALGEIRRSVTLSPLEPSAQQLAAARERRQRLYRLRVHSRTDLWAVERTPLGLITDLAPLGDILECALDFSALRGLSDVESADLAYGLLLATRAEPHEILTAAELPTERLTEIPMSPACIDDRRLPGGSGETLRVRVQLLEELTSLVAELDGEHARLLEQLGVLEGSSADSAELRSTASELGQVTRKLGAVALRACRQPVGTLSAKLLLAVQGLAKSLAKELELTVTGQEVELDGQLLEAVSEPLTHLIRNCADHGIETPNERERAGKSRIGQVRLSASQGPDWVELRVEDDGRGLDSEVLRGRAIERGLLSAEEARQLSEREVHALIFSPGVSTAPTVTELSGRGVGLDVVKTRVESLGGSLTVDSRVGRGTSIRLRFPLTSFDSPVDPVRQDEERQ